MRRIVDTAYGADADGNRGVTVVDYEIEASDYDTIKPQVDEYLSSLNEDEDPDSTLVVNLIDPVTEEDVYLEINIKDYQYRSCK